MADLEAFGKEAQSRKPPYPLAVFSESDVSEVIELPLPCSPAARWMTHL